ncbi:tRNA (adenosine(37)-N6)-threonylcarbamoyltransferase complex transferase subunit TsaD [Candidatus Microgenomates bacterium]|nr:tRNA (adenosine(37)-N6)-threonylcarbamoyltransferase complex transferase subunit TsaD [Candidatus Microgenomates bacterium]
MKILGIETSCDETAAAIVEDGTKLISNVVASSQELHAKYGGIIPENAAREQVKSIIPVIKEAMVTDFDAIAVTYGPGLIGSLLIGVETAKTLSYVWNKPLIPVNHLVGHIYANWLGGKIPEFPALVLLVSGGHSELVLMKSHGEFTWLGGTRDDAAGECFDKCARILNLGYPGGPAIEKNAVPGGNIKLPRPMINESGFDFSFSGLKTALANSNKENPNQLAYELQEAVTDVLIKKTLLAAKEFNVRSILLAGGVAANKRLREKMKQEIARPAPGLAGENNKLVLELYVPEFKLCTDNAAYIASAAFFNYHPKSWRELDADPSVDIS